MGRAKPKIADYHFTTLVPQLGMVEVPDGRSFVMADLPGLIEGAHHGAGLGLEFLRHIERCRVIVHVIDMAAVEGRNPYNDYLIINKELESYKMNLSKRPQIVVANKMDLPNAKENLEKFKQQTGLNVIPISAYNMTNLEELEYKIADLLAVTKPFALFEEDEMAPEVVYEYQKDEPVFYVEKDSDGIYNVKGDKLYRIFQMTNFENESSVNRFARQLRSFGVDDELRKLGIKNGDLVRVFDFEFEFIE